MAVWVVVGHLSLALDWRLPLIDSPGLAVDVFIILSGFVIALLLERKAEPYPAYLVRRAFRLFPLYLPVLAISALLLPVQLEAWEAATSSPANLLRVERARSALAEPWAHLLVHIPLVQGLVPRFASTDMAYTIVGQAWSISLEWQFYLVAPMLVAAMVGQRWWSVIATVLVLSALSPFFSQAFLGAKIALFIIGMASRLAMSGTHRRAALLACAAGASLALARGGAWMLVPLATWALVMASTLPEPDSRGRILARVLESRFLCHLGDISYALYLVHMVPLFLSILLVHRLGWDGAAADAAIALATLGLAYVGSVACHHLVEQPGIRAGARLAKRITHPSR